jgi:HEAT repeat protein
MPQPPQPPAAFREGPIATFSAPELIAMLKDPAASEFQKAKACVRLGELGSVDAVPALAALLGDEHLGAYARNGLEPIPGPEAAAALRAALPRLGAIESLAKRRDAASVPALVRLLHSPDPAQARAAAGALGRIGGPIAQKELQAALSRSTGPQRTAVANACLLCAESLLESGARAQALALYATLSTPAIPAPVRLAAMAAIIAEENSPHRPR